MGKSKAVGIVDFQMGNLFSVRHACSFVGLEPEIFSDFRKIKTYDALILPGVGAFGEAMRNLKELNLDKPLLDFIADGKPFLGICLGMQLLFSESEEFGTHTGLNVIPGKVVRFPNVNKSGGPVKVPHIGWNRIFPPQEKPGTPWEKTPLEGIAPGEFMYFVHSYYAVPANPKHVLTTTTYGSIAYCSSIIHGNVIATQFHPEKSAQKGLAIYQNWATTI
jgi:imidazole glycerol-phosphate synthase subunit HisH